MVESNLDDGPPKENVHLRQILRSYHNYCNELLLLSDPVELHPRLTSGLAPSIELRLNYSHFYLIDAHEP